MKIGDKLLCIKNKKHFFIKNQTYIIKNIEYKSFIDNNLTEYKYTFISIESKYPLTSLTLPVFKFVDTYNKNLVSMWKEWLLKEYFYTITEARKYKLKKISGKYKIFPQKKIFCSPLLSLSNHLT